MQLIAQQKANSVTAVKCMIIFKPFAVGAKTIGILEAMVEATHKITEADTIAVEANLEAVAVAEVTLVAVAEAVAEAEAVVEAKAEVHLPAEAVVDEAERAEATEMVAYAKLEKKAKMAK